MICEKCKKEIKQKPIKATEPINHLIDLFKFNPGYEKFFKNKTQRDAVLRVKLKIGEERMVKILNILPNIMFNSKYAPRIMSPLELENKLGKLLIFLKHETADSIDI